MKTKAPRHLQPETRKWYAAIAQRFVLEAHHEKLLLLAGECWDRSREAREVLSREGLTVSDKYGQVKAHPAAQIERDARNGFMRALRELGLDLTQEAPRPPIVKPGERR